MSCNIHVPVHPFPGAHTTRAILKDSTVPAWSPARHITIKFYPLVEAMVWVSGIVHESPDRAQAPIWRKKKERRKKKGMPLRIRVETAEKKKDDVGRTWE
jgi:hypothetical protein